MSTRELIEAAHAGDVAGFEKSFLNVVTTKLSEALATRKREIVAEVFNIDLANQELTEEEYDIIAEALLDLDEEQLNTVAEMEILEAAAFLEERFQKGVKLKPDTAGQAVKRGALSGAVKGAATGAGVGGLVAGPAGAAAGAAVGTAIGAAGNAASHALDHGINKSVKAVGRGVKRVAKALSGNK